MNKSWMYHRDFPKGVIFDEEQLDELDAGWVDTPAKLKDEPKVVKKKTTKKRSIK